MKEDVTTSMEPQIEISEESQNDTIPVPNNDFIQTDATPGTPPKQLRCSSRIQKTPDRFNSSARGRNVVYGTMTILYHHCTCLNNNVCGCFELCMLLFCSKLIVSVFGAIWLVHVSI